MASIYYAEEIFSAASSVSGGDLRNASPFGNLTDTEY